MRVCLDVEANSLINPTKVWCIVCQDIDTGKIYIFRNLHEDQEEKKRFTTFAETVEHWIGHNLLGYDYTCLARAIGVRLGGFPYNVTDTLVVSRLCDYPRVGGHSVEQYGDEFGYPKIKFSDFTKWSQELEDYCVRDVEICLRIYNKYLRVVRDPAWAPALLHAHRLQYLCLDLHDNGFAFDTKRATALLGYVDEQLKALDDEIARAFPPKEVLIREFIPKATKYGTISKTSVPRSLWDNITSYEIGQTYRHTRTVPFNPSSHKQLIALLTEAKWNPEDKTQSHIDCERELAIARRTGGGAELREKLDGLKKTGWKVNEQNLSTLPEDAPASARSLAKRILLESRRRSLTEWLGLVGEDGRIHGEFHGIGAWTHRMAHRKPNTANIPSEFKEDGSVKLLGKEIRQLWRADKNRLLVGVDAEGIQLRIFAHYINDPEFIDALVRGRKEDKTDPHSLNQRILGDVCRTRQAAKRFIYALLLGAGMGKLAQVLGASSDETRRALERLLERYQGLAYLKKTVIPADAKRGWFTGLDGRSVVIPGASASERRHLCMSGYLQNGEAIVVGQTVLDTVDELKREGIENKLINIVHDEVLFEIKNSVRLAEKVGKIFCNNIEAVGRKFNLKCPLAGDAKYGLTWYDVH